MKFKHAFSRGEPPGGGASLEELISPDNEVRFIDAFVNSLPLVQLGFRTVFPENGRPAYRLNRILSLIVDIIFCRPKNIGDFHLL